MNVKKVITDYRLWLALSLVIFSFTIFIIRENKTKEYEFLSPCISYVDKKDLLVNFSPLAKKLTNKYSNNKKIFVSLYFEYLPTGANFSLNRDEKLWPASLIKIPFSMVAMKKIEKGELSLSQLLTIEEDFRDSDYGSLYLLPVGSKISVENLLREALINSDNTAYLTLINQTNNKEIEEAFSHLGLEAEFYHILETFEKDGSADISMTTKQYSVFFRSLYNSTYLSPYYSNLFLDILSDADCIFLCPSIPSNIKVAHKFGIHEEKKIFADSGLFYVPNRPYMLTVIIRNDGDVSDSQIQRVFDDISKTIFDYVYYLE
jgi:beta-lactamase class A